MMKRELVKVNEVPQGEISLYRLSEGYFESYEIILETGSHVSFNSLGVAESFIDLRAKTLLEEAEQSANTLGAGVKAILVILVMISMVVLGVAGFVILMLGVVVKIVR